MSKNRQNYDADELDATIEAVLAAASKVTVAPDGYTDQNWNTGNPAAAGSSSTSTAASSRNPSAMYQGGSAGGYPAGQNNNNNNNYQQHPSGGAGGSVSSRGNSQVPMPVSQQQHQQGGYPGNNNNQLQHQQQNGNNNTNPPGTNNNNYYVNNNSNTTNNQHYSYHNATLQPPPPSAQNHVHHHYYQGNGNQQQQQQQHSTQDGYSQVTPRSPPQSGRGVSHSHHQQHQQQQLHPDDDVDALTEGILRKKYPNNNNNSGPSSIPQSARSGNLTGRSSRPDDLEGTRNANWQQQQQQQQQQHHQSPDLNQQNTGRSHQSTNSQNIPKALLRQREEEQAAAAAAAGSPNNKDGSSSKRRSLRSPEENARLKADNDFVIRRMELWQYKKDRERIQAEMEREEREMTGCTFQPDIESARKEVEADPMNPANMSPSALYYGNHAWGFDSFVRRLEIARERKIDKELQDAEAFRVKGPAAAKFRSGQQRTTVPEPFEFAGSGANHNAKKLEHHLMTSGRTSVGGAPGGPSLVALRRGQPLHPHQGIRASNVEKIAEERSKIRQESGATVPSGAFSQHGAWKDIANSV